MLKNLFFPHLVKKCKRVNRNFPVLCLFQIHLFENLRTINLECCRRLSSLLCHIALTEVEYYQKVIVKDIVFYVFNAVIIL